MKYIIKNLKSLVVNEKIIFSLLIVCVIVSTLVIQFSYGIYQNYHVIIEQGESEYREIYIEFNNTPDDFVTVDDVMVCMRNFPKSLYENILICSPCHQESTFRETYDDVGDVVTESMYIEELGEWVDDVVVDDPAFDFMLPVSFDENGEFINCKRLKANAENYNTLEGRWFTEDEFNTGADVCIVGMNVSTLRVSPFTDEDDNELFNISHNGVVEENAYTNRFGDCFEAIGVYALGTTIYPIYSVDGSYRIDYLFLNTLLPITGGQYEDLSRIMESELGDYVDMPEVEFTESKQTYLYKTILIICALVSVAAGINFIILFRFIMLKRKRKFAIFRLCGCSSFKCVTMCLAECLTLTAPLYIASTIVFDKFIVKIFSDSYPYMQSANSLKIYTILGLLYIGITTIIALSMLIVNISKVSIVSDKEGK